VKAGCWNTFGTRLIEFSNLPVKEYFERTYCFKKNNPPILLSEGCIHLNTVE